MKTNEAILNNRILEYSIPYQFNLKDQPNRILREEECSNLAYLIVWVSDDFTIAGMHNYSIHCDVN